MQLEGGITLSEALALNGGTLESLSGTNTSAAPINLNASSTILVDVGQLTVNGQISGTADLTKTGGGTLTLNVANTLHRPDQRQRRHRAGRQHQRHHLTRAPMHQQRRRPHRVRRGHRQRGGGQRGHAPAQPGAATTYVGKQLVLNGTGLGLILSSLLLPTGALQNVAGQQRRQHLDRQHRPEHATRRSAPP